MKFKYIPFILYFITAGASACSFTWHSYGSDNIKVKIAKSIGEKIPESFCKYAKTYEIVIVMDSFTTQTLSAGYATAGLRKKGSPEMPVRRNSSIQTDNGNYTLSYGEDLAAQAALITVIEIMSDIPSYLPTK